MSADPHPIPEALVARIANARAAARLPSAWDDAAEAPYVVGRAYFFRTVTYHTVGVFAGSTEATLLLVDAAWVADSGRWGTALLTGKLAEVEPNPDPVVLNKGAIVDVTVWRHPLPLEQK